MSEDLEDWDTVARAIVVNRTLRAWKQKDLADRSGVALSTIGELEQNKDQRSRHPSTLSKLSEAFGREPDYLAGILYGKITFEKDLAAWLSSGQSGGGVDDHLRVLTDKLSNLETVVTDNFSEVRADITKILRRVDSRFPNAGNGLAGS